jgi:hypothetical protein
MTSSPDSPEPFLLRLQARMAKGQSLEEAAEAYGLQLWSAKAIFVRSGLPVPRPLHRRVGEDVPPSPLGRRIHNYLKQNDSARASEISRALDVSVGKVRKEIMVIDKHRVLPELTLEERYPDVAILIGLQRMAIDIARRKGGTGRFPVSPTWWDEHRDREVHPSAGLVKERFGSWAAACMAAGVPVR